MKQVKKAEVSLPDFQFEEELMCQGIYPVCGVDEVGRGPWAGPVVAAAVILDPDNIAVGINDSKQVSVSKREELCTILQTQAVSAIGLATVEEIDRLNILQASLLAMRRAVERLAQKPEYALIDGNRMPEISCAGQAVIKGDTKSLSIAAASIIAKVTRDKMMAKLHEEFPHYGWNTNMGYGTAKHRKALDEVGVSRWHRRSFKPVRHRLKNASS